MANGAVDMARNERLAAARAEAYATPLEEFQVADRSLFTSDTTGPGSSRCEARIRSTGAKAASSAPSDRSPSSTTSRG